MKLQRVREGRRFSIYALDLSDREGGPDCPGIEYLEQLRRTKIRSHKRFTLVLQHHADNWPLMNEEISRDLGDGIFEFKTRDNDRLLCFYAPGNIELLSRDHQSKDAERPMARGASKVTMKREQRDPAPGLLDKYVEEYEQDPDYVAESLALQLMEEASRIMRETGISRAALAERMGVSKPYVTRMFNAPANLTLRSIAQLSLALSTKPHASLRPSCSEVTGVQ